MQAKLNSSALCGIDAYRVIVEVSINKGLGVMISGLPDNAIRESYNRIAVALTTNKFSVPRTKLVINLSPADIRKSGTAFDLPIALGILVASGQLEETERLKETVIVGELGLDGSLHPVRGALNMVHQAKIDGFKNVIVPTANAHEAVIVDGIVVYPAENLSEAVSILKEENLITPFEHKKYFVTSEHELDFAEVKGQHAVKRALEIAAAGGHNAVMIGPPGSSKTMLAKRMPTILPPMTIDECLETTRIHSVTNSGNQKFDMISERPFRSPHHTCSDVALVGGGSFPIPGEISLAHNGVLFLDELGEFRRSVIESLRQPMEDRKVLIARAQSSLEFPSSFMLLAAMNPCPCGYNGHPAIRCHCSKNALFWYRRKISGPLLERIDLHVMVDPVPVESLMSTHTGEENSSTIRARVTKARKIQSVRFANLTGVYSNAQIPPASIQDHCHLEESAKKFLWKRMEEWQLSARSFTRILKVARTIADLAQKDAIEIQHIAEALHFRILDKPADPPTPAKAHRKKAENEW